MIINITEVDIKKAQPPKGGWMKAKLMSPATSEPSSDKLSINYKFCFEVTEGSESGKWGYAQANSKAMGIIFLPMISALMDVRVDELKPEGIDMDKVYGKECYIKVNKDTYQGRETTKVEEFASLQSPPI